MRELQPDIEQRDYAKKPLTKEEVLALVKLAGGVAPLVSTRNTIVKERGWAATRRTMLPIEDEMLSMTTMVKPLEA